MTLEEAIKIVCNIIAMQCSEYLDKNDIQWSSDRDAEAFSTIINAVVKGELK